MYLALLGSQNLVNTCSTHVLLCAVNVRSLNSHIRNLIPAMELEHLASLIRSYRCFPGLCIPGTIRSPSQLCLPRSRLDGFTK